MGKQGKGLSWELIVRAVLLLGLLTAGLLALPYLWPLVTERERIEVWLAANRGAGALALVLLNALQVMIAPLPGALLGWVSGYWFGPWWGSLLTWFGVSLGNGLTMVLARRLGRPLLIAFLPKERLDRVDRLIHRYGLTAVVVVFLLPLTPDDVLAWAIGLSPLPLLPAFAVSTLARLVHVLIANAIGAYLGSGELLWLGMAGLLGLGAFMLAWRIAQLARLSPAELYREKEGSP
ncbi:MAG: VTT domain-containing protein [Anaerolineae bacterium]|nr:VTT domain-containing protein [Anaerolineae bacterium]